jgi:ferredoxin
MATSSTASGRQAAHAFTEDSGKMVIDITLCLHCGACVGSCPTNSIFMHETLNTFDDKCTQCGLCARVCAVGAIDYPRGHRLSQLR